MYDLEPMPSTPVWMAGDVPIPFPEPPPIAPPTEGPPPIPAPPIPHIGNPVPYVVHGAEAAWSDVASWVSSAWHGLTGFLSGGFTLGWDEVKNLVDIALQYEQTAWASFVSTLESWINESVSFLEGAIADVQSLGIVLTLDLYYELVDTIHNVEVALWDSVVGIDQALARQWWDTVQAIDNAEANLRTWAIDNIYNPLLQDVWNTVRWAEDTINADVRALEDEIAHINTSEIPGILAKLGVIAAAITAVESWVTDCGEPLCEQMGPKTDWSKLLKVLNVAGMLALLTSVGTLTEAQLEQLAAAIVSLGESPAGTFVDDFVSQGDTLAAAIADAVPQIAL